MAAPMSAQAVRYKLSGQVNRAVVFQDDGEQSDVNSTPRPACQVRRITTSSSPARACDATDRRILPREVMGFCSCKPPSFVAIKDSGDACRRQPVGVSPGML